LSILFADDFQILAKGLINPGSKILTAKSAISPYQLQALP
jgi:hypothetical protein